MSYEFSLFIAGKTSKKSCEILHCVNTLLKKRLKSNYELTVIDVIDSPDQAIKFDIFVTPSWIRLIPKPPIKLVGNFCEEKNVAKAYDFFTEVINGR